MTKWCLTSLMYKFLQIQQKKTITFEGSPCKLFQSMAFGGYSWSQEWALEQEYLCIIAMQVLNLPRRNQVASIWQVPKKKKYLHISESLKSFT